MPDDFASIKIDGLDEWSRQLRRVEPAMKKQLDKDIRTATNKIRDRARAAYRRMYPGRGRRGKRSRNQIRSRYSRGQAVVFGANAAEFPHMTGQEWGARRGAFSNQFPLWRAAPGGKGAIGYYFWPNVVEARGELFDDIHKALRKSMGKAFPE